MTNEPTRTGSSQVNAGLLIAQARLDERQSQSVMRLLLDTQTRPGATARMTHRLIAGGIPPVLFPALAVAGTDTSMAVLEGAVVAQPWQSIACRATGARPRSAVEAAIVVCLTAVPPELVARMAGAPGSNRRLCLAARALRPAMEGTDCPRGVVRLSVTGPDASTRMVDIEGIHAGVFEALGDQRRSSLDVHLIDRSGCVASLPSNASIRLRSSARAGTP